MKKDVYDKMYEDIKKLTKEVKQKSKQMREDDTIILSIFEDDYNPVADQVNDLRWEMQ